jgi:preprotein translocase subunit SecA
VDRQLRGRSARQGDPGESKFFLSFEDDLMRNFGAAERMTKVMERFGMKEGEELQHPWLNRSVETAQKRVEQRNYTWRKRVLEYDDVMNQQREVVYEWRNEVLTSNDPRVLLNEAVEKGLNDRLEEFIPKADPSLANFEGLLNWVNASFPIGLTAEEAKFETRDFEGNAAFLQERILKAYDLKISGANPQALQEVEKMILLNAIDRLWQEHLYALDALKEGISLRSYGQKDPLIEFKQEAFNIFSALITNINNEILANLFRSSQQLAAFEQFLAQMAQMQRQQATQLSIEGDSGDKNRKPQPEAPPHNPAIDGPRLILPSSAPKHPGHAKRPATNVGRNDPCPCGSGKKYKQCCGRLA